MSQALNRVSTWAGLVVALALGACAPLISGYSLDAYKNATTLKAETLALVDESGEPYADHSAQVKTLTTKLNAAYEFSAGAPKNEISAQQWRLLIDPDRNLYGGFVKVWKTQSTTSEAYRTGKKKQLGQAFDYIACLEINKKEAKSCASLQSQGEVQ